MSKPIPNLRFSEPSGATCQGYLPEASDAAAAAAAGKQRPLFIMQCTSPASTRVTTMTLATPAEIEALRRPGAVGVQLGACTCVPVDTDPKQLVCEDPSAPPVTRFVTVETVDKPNP